MDFASARLSEVKKLNKEKSKSKSKSTGSRPSRPMTDRNVRTSKVNVPTIDEEMLCKCFDKCCKAFIQ